MQTEHGKIEGDISVRGDYALHGLVTGSIRVLGGGNLRLHGMCCKDLFVERGGTASVQGMVSGNVINDGGTLTISGMVSGQLSTRSGQTKVMPGALIHGEKA